MINFKQKNNNEIEPYKYAPIDYNNKLNPRQPFPLPDRRWALYSSTEYESRNRYSLVFFDRYSFSKL